MTGTLHIVATPLGNLEDMTFRAVAVLRQAAVIAAEDTRRTRKLLSHFGITVKLVSYREQNHRKMAPMLLDTLTGGGDVALVTDAGTPGVSDPGALLVEEAVKNGVRVTPAPGVSAAAAALSASGLPADRYLFAGFLPSRAKARADFLGRLKDAPFTLVFFEAPHRLADALKDMAAILGDRPAVIGREMTKLNEEFMRGDLAGLAEKVAAMETVRGEITIVTAGAEGRAGMLDREELRALIRDDRRGTKEIAADLAGCSELSRSDLYRLILEVRKEET